MTRNSTLRNAKGWIVGTAFTLLTAAPALAQDAPQKSKSALDSYLLDGGPLTIFIVAVGLISLISLTVFNFMNLTKAKFAPEDLKQLGMLELVVQRAGVGEAVVADEGAATDDVELRLEPGRAADPVQRGRGGLERGPRRPGRSG